MGYNYQRLEFTGMIVMLFLLLVKCNRLAKSLVRRKSLMWSIVCFFYVLAHKDAVVCMVPESP